MDCLLYGDPSLDPEEEHDGRKRARSKGRNIRLDILMRHITRDHPDAAREGSRSLISFGFTRHAIRGHQGAIKTNSEMDEEGGRAECS